MNPGDGHLFGTEFNPLNELDNPMSTPKIALIIGSTRDSRFADVPAQWMLAQAKARTDMEVELVDLRDYDLPLFNEVASNAWAPSQSAAAVKWQKKIGEFDGYIFVVAEYNRSITGALEHLRTIGVELQMVPTRNAVHLGMGDFFKVHPGMGGSGNMADVEANLLPAATASLDDLVWWAKATKAARG